ncbi:unnamed protein product [Camellia sinensis]
MHTMLKKSSRSLGIHYWMAGIYQDEIAIEKAVGEVQENVLGVLRVALDTHHVVTIPEHLYPSLVGPCYHLCFWGEFPYLLHYILD